MKILQLTWSLDNGGAEKFAVELSNELADLGHQVTLCSVRKKTIEMIPATMIAENIKLLELHTGWKYSLRLYIKLLNLIDPEKFDVVHVHSSILILYLQSISLFRRVKIIHTVHNTITEGYRKLFNFLSWTSFYTGRINHVCISESILKKYSYAFPRFRFIYIDNGIKPLSLTSRLESVIEEIEILKNSKSTRVFLAIGNYSVYKNFICLAKIFKQFENENQDTILIILGEDRSPGQLQYKEVIQSKGVNTFLLGLKQNVSDYISLSDALVISSTMEGMPLVALEALSMGKPVISTPAGGMVDVIKNGQNGYLTGSFSEDELTKAIREFLNLNNKVLAEMSEQAFKSFESTYHIRTCTNRYLAIYG